MDKILNKDCLQYLFSFFSVEDLRELRLVCKGFNKLSHHVWKETVYKSAATELQEHKYTYSYNITYMNPFGSRVTKMTFVCKRCGTDNRYEECIYSCTDCKRVMCDRIIPYCWSVKRQSCKLCYFCWKDEFRNV